MRGFHVALAALFVAVGAEAFDGEHVSHPLVVSDNLTLSEVVRQASDHAGTPELLAANLAEAEAMASDAKLVLNAAPALSVRYNGDAPGEDRGLSEIETRLTMALKWPGLRAAQHRVAAVAARPAESSAEAGLWRIAGATREVMWEYRTAADERDAARDAYAQRQPAGGFRTARARTGTRGCHRQRTRRGTPLFLAKRFARNPRVYRRNAARCGRDRATSLTA